MKTSAIKIKSSYRLIHIVIPMVLVLLNNVARSQVILREITHVKVVNMIPQSSSSETGNDAEPNIAVNPSKPTDIVGTAFTRNPTGAFNRAPIFVSSDEGSTWALNNIVPSGNGMTGDITVRYADRGDTLYCGILRGGSGLNVRILRTGDPFGSALMTQLVNNPVQQDQPYVQAATTDSSGIDIDRVYVGFNNFSQRLALGGTGRTAMIEHSMDARATAPPAGFTQNTIESRATFQQDMPAIRPTIHSDGTIYAVFYSWTATNAPNATCDVVVVRDDNWGIGPNPYSDLIDGGDLDTGMRVVTGITVPAFPANLGSNRLVASNLSIQVNPKNSDEVWVAWADNNGSNYTLHVRRSTDRGVTWSTSDIKTVLNATNPALAISVNKVGFLYQQLTANPGQQWQTHFETTSNNGATWKDILLARTSDTQPAGFFIGDYVHVMAVGKTFYGIFSASNKPDNANFPQGIKYLRNANFTSNKLFDTSGTTEVNVSIDPYFFKVSYNRIFDICRINPRYCKIPVFDPGIIRIPVCNQLPCIVIDPIPKNCLVKWSCPGCENLTLCPPWFHIYLEDFDPRVWDIHVYTSDGELVQQKIQRNKNGIIITFRPAKDLYNEKEIGDYALGFEALKGIELNKEYVIKTRLEVSDYPVPGKGLK